MGTFEERTYRVRGEIILERIEERNLTRKRLAQLAEVTPKTLRAWINGKPAYRTHIAQLAEAIGVSIYDLLIDYKFDGDVFSPPDFVVIKESDSNKFSLSIRSWMAALNVAVERLTRDQHSVIQELVDCRRALIGGCAGSGKTLVAAEKAARCALAGNSTLFLCHSPRLAKNVAEMLRGTGVKVEDFGDWVRKLANLPSADSWTNLDEPDDHARDLARNALKRRPPKHRVIIVDEGQDFRKEWWELVEAGLDDESRHSLYIFHDDHQALFPGRKDYPNVHSTRNLSRNCRNSGKIFELTRMLYNCPLVSPARKPALNSQGMFGEP